MNKPQALAARSLLMIALLLRAQSTHAAPTQAWTQLGSKLLLNPDYPSDQIVSSVAVFGNVAVAGVGNIWNGVPVGGTAQVFTVTPGAWTAGPQLRVAVPMANDHMGTSLAVSGDTIVVGAVDNARCTAYVFRRNGALWPLEGTLVAPTCTTHDNFGTAVAIDGDSVVVSAPEVLVNGSAITYGVVYAFERTGTTWSQATPMVADDNSGALFGSAVALHKDTLFVGANAFPKGKTYIFKRVGGTWILQGPPVLAPSEGDGFGSSLALDGDTALVGAPYSAMENTVGAGAVYVLGPQAGGWVVRSVLRPSDPAMNGAFGSAVALSGATAVVGAPLAGNGEVYVFASDGATWTQQGNPLVDSVPQSFDWFGNAVSVSGNTFIVGNSSKLGGEAVIFTDGPCSLDTDCPSTAYCSAGICVQRCNHDTDCPTGFHCPLSGACQKQVDLGAACSCKDAGCNPCSSGNCVDGVCCNTACTGTCQACSAALNGTKDGECLPVPADQDPKDQCEPDAAYPASCLADGLCDGAGACRMNAKPGTSCGPTVCNAGAVVGSLCDGKGSCTESEAASCAPGVCLEAACTTQCRSNADCDAQTGVCSHGTCAEKVANSDAGAGGEAGAGPEAGASGEGGAGSSRGGSSSAPIAAQAGDAGAGAPQTAGAGPQVEDSVAACGCRVGSRPRSEQATLGLLLLSILCQARRRRRSRAV